MEHTAASPSGGSAESRSTEEEQSAATFNNAGATGRPADSGNAAATGRPASSGNPAATGRPASSGNPAARGRSREQEEAAAAAAAWKNVGGVERWASLAAGAGLLMAAYSRRTRLSALGAAVGSMLLYRGATGHCPVNARIGRNTAGDNTRTALGGSRGLHVKESVTIDRPVSELFSFWRNFENLPRFMDHLEAVTTTGRDRSHWVAKAPAGLRVEWDAEIINEVENQVIGWQSLPGSDVTSAGSVNFDDAGPGRGTRITVHLQYDPPAGKLGALFAKVFGEEPSQQIHEDLRRLKRLLEAGEVPTTEGQSSGRRPERSRRSGVAAGREGQGPRPAKAKLRKAKPRRTA